MKNKKYYIPLEIDIYPIKIHVFLNYKEKDKKLAYKNIFKFTKKNISKEYKKNIKEIINNLDLENALGWTTSYEGNSIIFINKFTLKKLDVLVHEAMHAVANAGRYIVMPLGPDSEEFYCYLIGHIIEKVLKKIRKK